MPNNREGKFSRYGATTVDQMRHFIQFHADEDCFEFVGEYMEDDDGNVYEVSVTVSLRKLTAEERQKVIDADDDL